MTDARAITLRPEAMGAPSPAARSVRLAVEVLMSNPLPITVTPQAGHLLFTGHAPVYARARTLNAEVMSAGTPQARVMTLAIEVMTPNIESSVTLIEPTLGHLVFTGHIPAAINFDPIPQSARGKSLPPIIIAPHVTRYPSLKTEGPS